MSIVRIEQKLPYGDYKPFLEQFAAGYVEPLEADIGRRLATDPAFPVYLLYWALWGERAANDYPFSVWLLKSVDTLAGGSETIDLGLVVAVHRWRTDAIERFLELGANPNQQVIPERLLLDVCLNRLDFFYSLDKQELEQAVALLRQHQARSYQQNQYHTRIGDQHLFELVDGRDAWVPHMTSDLSQLDRSVQQQWVAIIGHCRSKSKSPSKAWIKKLDDLIANMDRQALVTAAGQWLSQACEPRATLIFGDMEGGPYYLASDTLKEANDLWAITENNGLVLKGLCWLLARCDDTAVEPLSRLAEAMYTKYPLRGVRDVKLANAAYDTLLGLRPNGIHHAMRIYQQADNKPAAGKMKAMLEKYAKAHDISWNKLSLLV